MNTTAHLRSLSLEIDALKNRVRNFITDTHWQTDGEWKESVLRSMIKRHMPSDVEVGRGFVVKQYNCSNQIDVLIYDSTKPLLYRDGDLVFVTPDAVKGIIEVKSSDASLAALSKLANNAEFVQNDVNPDILLATPQEIFVGFFCYDWRFSERRVNSILRNLQKTAQGRRERVINHLSLGNELFIHFWRFRPELQFVLSAHNRWHSYRMQDLAPGYFIHNIIASVARSSVSLNNDIWFPAEGKEGQKLKEMPLFENEQN